MNVSKEECHPYLSLQRPHGYVIRGYCEGIPNVGAGVEEHENDICAVDALTVGCCAHDIEWDGGWGDEAW